MSMVSFYERPESQITSVFAQASQTGFGANTTNRADNSETADATTIAQTDNQDTLDLIPGEISLRDRINNLLNSDPSKALKFLQTALENPLANTLDDIADIAYDAYQHLLNIGDFDAAAHLNTIAEGQGISLVKRWNNEIENKPPEPSPALQAPSPFN